MSPVGFEPTMSAGEPPQTQALDRAVTGTGESGSNAEEKYWAIPHVKIGT